MKRHLGLLLVLLLVHTSAWALAPAGMMGEDFAVRLHQSLIGVWLPWAGLIGVLGIGFMLIAGHTHGILQKVIGLVIILALLQAGGVPILSTIAGGAFGAAGATLEQGASR